ncbi:hypothetical protein [Croceimicrobium sp.]|uniref:hypothetical protein n=1 Tax=Croceimicrobium sp. TaxID=2828340 RepID=UPI003BAD305E
MRGLALAALVTAFTLPYSNTTAEASAQKKQYLHLYVDNSLSMKRDGSKGPLLNQARLFSSQFLASLGDEIEVQILSNDFDSRYQRYYPASEAKELAEQLDYSSEFRSLEEVLNRIRNLSIQNPEAQHQILLLSDFQAGILNTEAFESAANEEVKLLALSSESGLNNASIDSLTFKAPVFVPGLVQDMEVFLHNYSQEKLSGISLEFWLNDTLQNARIVDLEAQQSTAFPISFIPQKPGAYQGKISISKGEPSFDNQFYFSFQTLGKQKVYYLSEKEKSELPLNIFRDPYFELKKSSLQDLDYDYLAEARLIIVESNQNISESLKQRLEEHLQKGKNIWFFPGKDIAVYQSQLQSLGIKIAGQWIQDSLMAQSLNANDPYLENTFIESRQAPLLPFSKTHVLSEDGSSIALLSFSKNRSLLARKPMGKGQVFYALSSLDPEQSNLAGHPLIIPLLANASFYVGGKAKPYVHAGNASDYQIIEANQVEEALKIVTKDGELIPYQSFQNDHYELRLGSQNLEAGNYPLIRDQENIAYFSVNLDSRESLMQASKLKLNELFKPEAQIIDPSSNQEQAQLKASILMENTALWPWFVLLTLLFLFLEMLFLKSGRR